MKHPSFQDHVVYQIYPRSYQDSNGDGIGDIKGIISRLDHIKDLGATAIWLSPVFESPMEDNGYDISDYYKIDPLFGTNEDMDELIKECDKRGLKLILDMVLNHTSDQHKWFKEAKKSKDNPYRDFYIWRKEPNDMIATFGGSMWEYSKETDEYYFHMFAPAQPDLNWHNEALRNEMYKMMNFWLDKGVYGFRLDVIENLGKEPDNKICSNGPTLHSIIHDISKHTFGPRDSITIGEAWGSNSQNRYLYTDPEREELSMIFLFDHFTRFYSDKYGKWQLKPFDMPSLRNAFFDHQTGDPNKNWDTIFWNNHDLPRAVSRYVDPNYRKDGAKMLFASTLFMRGTPFIYQGDEIGMANAHFPSKNDYRDVESINAFSDLVKDGLSAEEAFNGIAAVSRDNARIPMQWEAQENFGFTKGTPWLKGSIDDYAWTVEEEAKDPTSILSFYKEALGIWHDEKYRAIIRDGSFLPHYDDSRHLMAYQRVLNDKKLVVIANFSNEEIIKPITEGDVILRNLEHEENVMKPYEIIVTYVG